MDKALAVKSLERCGGGKRRSSSGDDFLDGGAALFDGGDNGKQPFVTAMGGGNALGFVDSTEVAVIVMKTTKFERCVPNCADEADDFGVMILLDTRAVHTRIDVEKNADA